MLCVAVHEEIGPSALPPSTAADSVEHKPGSAVTSATSAEFMSAAAAEKEVEDFKAALSTFRAPNTIFEVLQHTDNVMRNKRKTHDKVIRKQAATLSAAAASTGADDDLDMDGSGYGSGGDGEGEGEGDEKSLAMGDDSVEEEGGDGEGESEDDQVPAASAAAASRSRIAVAAAGHKRLSAAERKKQKRKRDDSVAPSPAAAASEIDDSDSKSAAAAAKIKKSKQQSFRDPAFFVGHTPGDQSTEAGYSLEGKTGVVGGVMGAQGGGGGSGGDRLDDLVMELPPDDNDGANKQRIQKTWDRTKKKYVGQAHVATGEWFSGKAKVRDDSGRLIEKDNGPSPYELWQKKQRGSGGAFTPATADASEGGDEDGGSGSGGRTPGPSGAGVDMRSGRGGRGRGARAMAARGRGGGGRGGKTELKSADEIRKQRKEKEKRKDRHSKKRPKFDGPKQIPIHGAPTRSRVITRVGGGGGGGRSGSRGPPNKRTRR